MRSLNNRRLLASAAIVAAGFAYSNAATAADLLMDPPVMEAPEVVTKPAGGWYLRGDLSYKTQEIDDIYFNVPAEGNRRFTSSELSDSFGLQGGVGYQINENFRVDATLGYTFETDFTGSTDGGAFPCPSNPALGLAGGQLVGTTCTSTDTTSYSAYHVMANAYVDLGNFNGLTPYVGAGIGGAYVTYNTLTNAFNCTVADPLTGTCTGLADSDVHPGESSWRFAYALHAGVSYDVTHNLKLDFGYTYDRIEDGPMFGWTSAAVARSGGNLAGPQAHDEGITNHVFRVGMRYQIW